ncbi:MAG: hypothetical protein ABI683_13765 [Ginsengibacter sp.]
MTLNIIHLSKRIDRFELLEKEIRLQEISDYKIWDGVTDDMSTVRGISQAHKQIVRYAKEFKLPYILIAEDDIRFTSLGAFDFFIQNIPKDYDLYLGGIIYGKLEADNTVKDFSGTMLYLIHERFYDIFLSIPGNYHIDRGLNNKGKFVVCYPMAAIQYNGYSDSSKRNMKYDIYIKAKALFRNV